MKTKDKLKTIDVNLIGEKLTKKYTATPEEVDEKSKLISIIILSSTIAIFLICFCIWLSSIFFIKKTNKEIAELHARQEKLDTDLNATSSVYKNMQQEKSALQLELLVRNQLDNIILPWHDILVQISKAVPKDITITKINKSSNRSDSGNEIDIAGEVNSSASNSLDMISYLVLNINENLPENSYLSKAIIKNVDFDKKEGKYTFSIITGLKLPQKDIQEKKE